MHKTFSLTDRFLFVLTSYLPFLIFLWVFQMLNGVVLCTTFIATLLFLFLQTTKLKKWVIPIYGALIMLLLLSLIINFRDTINAIYNQITSVYAHSSNYTFQVYEVTLSQQELHFLFSRVWIALYLMIMLLEYLFIIRWKRHFPAFAISFLLYFPTMLYSVKQPWLLTCLLLMDWFTLLFLSYIRRHSTRSWHYGKLFGYVLVCFSLIFGTLFILLPEKEYEVSSTSSHMRQKLLQTIEQFTYNLRYGSESIGEIDLGRAGNRSYTGAIQMELTYPKASRLYLKTYSGAIYDGHTWKSLAHKQYRQYPNIDWTTIRFWMNQAALPKDIHANSLMIKDMRANTQYAIVPYYLKHINQDMNIYYDSYAAWSNSTKDAVTYEIWDDEQKILHVPQGTSYKEYVDFIKEQYLQLPKDIKEKFNTVEDLQDNFHRFASTEEIIDYVKGYLYAHTRYTLYPGSPDLSKDFVSYFLWENQEGYCVHYASSAVLLLRYYGVPARYVDGYRVDSNAYDHEGHAQVKDSDAHAWVEIFDETYGWMPVEVTPAADNDSTIQKSEQPLTQTTPSEITPGLENKEEPKPIQQPTQHLMEENGTTTTSASSSLPSFLLPVLVVLILPLFIYAQASLRRKYRRKQLGSMKQRQKLLTLYGWLEDLFPYGAKIDQETLQLVEKARFSQHEITKEDVQQLQSQWQTQRAHVLTTLSWQKKLRLWIWDAL